MDDTLQIIDKTLSAQPFIAGLEPTLADLVAYEELGQNQKKYANCSDYEPYPNIQSWFVRMAQLPFHDETHAIWTFIGDLNKLDGSGMSVLAAANKRAARLFAETAQAIG